MARLNFAVLQSGADAFTQASIQTALAGLTKTAYRIQGITYEVATAGSPFASAAAVQDFSVCLTRRSKTAMPELSDTDVIKKWKQGVQYGTAVGYFQQFGIHEEWVVPDPEAKKAEDGAILVVEEYLYVQIDSTGTGKTTQIYGYIDYETVTISEVDRLSLLTLSLQ